MREKLESLPLAVLKDLAKDKGVKIEYADKRKLDKMSLTSHHQGIIATITEFKYAELGDVIQKSKNIFKIITKNPQKRPNTSKTIKQPTPKNWQKT